MKSLLRAIAILALVMFMVKGPGAGWLEQLGVFSGDDPSAAAPRAPREAPLEYQNQDGSLSRADEARMLEDFDAGYQAPPECQGDAATSRCREHRQRRLNAFRQQWQNYFEQ